MITINDIGGDIIIEGDYASKKEAVEDAVRKGIRLSWTNLRGVDLSGANLSYANLEGANLEDAILKNANLCGANFMRANLMDAGLVSANLRGANLSYANLSYANLEGANLEDAILGLAYLGLANLRGANFENANLSHAILLGARLEGSNIESANLEPIKQDFIENILKLPDEIPNLRQAFINGEIDGSTYRGECACLAGTTAKTMGISIDELRDHKSGFKIDSYSPRECFAMAVKPGDTPENNPIAKLFVQWIDEALQVIKEGKV